MTTTLKPLFTWRGALCDSDLSPAARHVALTLSLHMSERGDSCFPGIRTLASECGRSPTTITTAIKELEEKDWLDVKRGGGRGKPNRYTATIPVNVTEVVTFLAEPVEETLQSVPVNVTAVVTEDVLLRGRKDQDLTPSPATPSKEERDNVWNALEEIFAAPTTPQGRARFGKLRKELLADSSLTPGEVVEEIPVRARRYREKWPEAYLTLEAFAKHWPDLDKDIPVNGNGFKPGRYGTGMTAAQVAALTEEQLDEMMA